MKGSVKRFNNKKVKKDEMLIWWLGNAGFFIKTNHYKVIIDPYLSDSVYSYLKPFFKNPEKELCRMMAPPFLPEEIECGYYICTHDHLDHLDPDTITEIRNKQDTYFIGPPSCSNHFRKLKVPEKNILTLNIGQKLTIDKDISITAVAAKHRGPLNL